MRNKIINILIEAEKLHRNNEEKSVQRVIGKKSDIVTESDIEIGEFIINQLLDSEYAITVESEEHGKQKNFESGQEDFYVVIDDIDGSNNLRVGRGFLPYCSMIVVFEKNENNYKFSDYKYVACIDYINKAIFYTENGLGRVEQYDLLGKIQITSNENIQNNRGLSLTLSTDIVSNYRGGTIGYANSIGQFAPEKSFNLENIYKNYAIVDSGCSVFEYAMVGMGIRNGYVACGKKMHELPLLYAFCKETEKELVDFEMNSYDKKVYNFNGNSATVIAGTRKLIKEVYDLILKL